MSDLPARVDDLDMVEVTDGFVVYQPARDRVHFFNHTAAVVLTLCDGTKDDDQIAKLVQRFYKLPDSPRDEVVRCLDQFRQEGLVH
jgi:hypothetical protein